jgi:hypothetical protein
MIKKITVPIKVVDGEDWADLSAHGPSIMHQICGETVKQYGDKSFAGGHRVRLYGFKKSVAWKVPSGIDLDISSVAPPRRQR